MVDDEDSGTEAVHVEVDVPATEPTETPEVVAPVTVMETGTDDTVTAAVIEHEGEITELASDVEEASSVAATAVAAAETAQQTADMAVQAATESVAQVAEMLAEAEPEPTPEDDVEPDRMHWFWR